MVVVVVVVVVAVVVVVVEVVQVVVGLGIVVVGEQASRLVSSYKGLFIRQAEFTGESRSSTTPHLHKRHTAKPRHVTLGEQVGWGRAPCRQILSRRRS